MNYNVVFQTLPIFGDIFKVMLLSSIYIKRKGTKWLVQQNKYLSETVDANMSINSFP